MPTSREQLEKLLEMNANQAGAIRFDEKLRQKLNQLECPLKYAIFSLMDKIMEEEFDAPYQMEKNVYNAERILNG